MINVVLLLLLFRIKRKNNNVKTGSCNGVKIKQSDGVTSITYGIIFHKYARVIKLCYYSLKLSYVKCTIKICS